MFEKLAERYGIPLPAKFLGWLRQWCGDISITRHTEELPPGVVWENKYDTVYYYSKGHKSSSLFAYADKLAQCYRHLKKGEHFMNNAFYHLSETLLDTITEDFNDIFKNINGNPSVLIPSAGDGVIADHLKQKAKTSYRKAEIDCIEEDPCLAKALETKDIFMVRLDCRPPMRTA